MADQPVVKPKILIAEPKLQARVKEIAQKINHDYRGLEITAVCVLKGSFVFFSDLIRQLDLSMSCEFLGLSSYGGQTTSSGEVKMTLDLNEPIEGRHVLVIEDIVDTGLTLEYIAHALKGRKPASLKICSLLVKPESMKTTLEVDYVGFTIGNEFVVGYGLDYAEKFRGLPYIGYIENEH
ncbi:MAG: hypoxanthine phosphoribosyltransferase [Bacteriovoracia bacterium]